MKIAMLIPLFAMLGGCALFNPAINGVPPTTQQTIDNLKLDVYDAVGATIILSDNSGAEARRIYNVASYINKLTKEVVNVSDLQHLAVDIASKFTVGRDRDKAVFLTNLLFNRLRRHLGIGDVAVIPPDKLELARSVLQDLSATAMEACRPYLVQ